MQIAMHAVCAFLASKGLAYGKHTAVQTALHRDIVKAGLVPREMGALFSKLFNARHDSDYKAFVTFAREEVAQDMFKVEEFIRVFRQLVEDERGLPAG